jgi:hypothetical protein
MIVHESLVSLILVIKKYLDLSQSILHSQTCTLH